jgi:RND superfamily putative drug exporter
VQTLKKLTEEFPAEGATATLVATSSAADGDNVVAALEAAEQRALASGHFVDSGRAVQTSANGRTSLLRLAMPYGESDDRVDTAIEALRGAIAPAAFSDVDAEYAVGGGPAASLDYLNHQKERLPLVIGFVLLLTLLMMAAAFRSLAIAVVSTALNLVSVGVAFGILTLVFQHGWLAGPLDFTSPGFVVDWIPLFIMVVLVGLSMDYHVFVLSRVREHRLRGLPPRLAVRQGVADTAGVVTSAAAVMVSVFAIFATLSMMEMKMMGVGLAAAILLDATVIRLVMLPAILVLLGDRAWWPGTPRGRRGAAAPPGEPVEEKEPAYL